MNVSIWKKVKTIQSLRAFRRAYPQHPILPHFRPSGPSENYRYGHSESSGLIGIEFGEFRRKLKNLEFHQNSIFRESMGAIWIGSMSFGMVPPLSIF